MRALLVALVLAASAVAGCSGGPLASESEDCIVLAMGGNKLCGEDAAAWCSSTDSLRETASDGAKPRASSATPRLAPRTPPPSRMTAGFFGLRYARAGLGRFQDAAAQLSQDEATGDEPPE